MRMSLTQRSPSLWRLWVNLSLADGWLSRTIRPRITWQVLPDPDSFKQERLCGRSKYPSQARLDLKLTPEAVNILTGLFVGWLPWASSQTVCWDVQPLRNLHQFCWRLSPVLHTDLFTLRCDYQKSDLIQNKVASLFKYDIKSDILEQSTQKKMNKEKSSGLLGGQYPINSFEHEYTLLYFRW